MTQVTFFPSPLLNTLAWSALLAIPLAVVLLYFLKLRREPLEVPSTLLWRRALEDLHVNSLWQRLRQNLLLLLQLIILFLIILACFQPGWKGSTLPGNRFILLLDTSASMQATDLPEPRLDMARQQALNVVDQMKDGDAAMILTASNVGRIEQPFTVNRSLLRDKLQEIRPTNRVTEFSEVLRYAAGLANPGRSSEDPGDVQVADALPATLYIFSDGGFESVPDFSLGNLQPEYVPIGVSSASNLAVTAFTIARNPEIPGRAQAFARIENLGIAEASTTIALMLDDQLKDAKELTVAAGEESSIVFDLAEETPGGYWLEISGSDDLSIDDVAFAVLNQPRRINVLVATPGNRYMQIALATEEAEKYAKVDYADPSVLLNEQHQQRADSGQYDLIIYDRCSPVRVPQANTIYFGSLPPGDTSETATADNQWSVGPTAGPPMITDVDKLHPLMQFVELGNVNIAEGFPVKGPTGSRVLIDSSIGPLLSIGPRRGFQDAVLGLEMVGPGELGEADVNTDWTRRRSFPVFLLNVLTYLGGGGRSASPPSVRPGELFVFRSSAQFEQIEIENPQGERTAAERDSQNQFVYSGTDRVGVYPIFAPEQEEPIHRFAVNLFNRRESDLKPRETIELGYEAVEGRPASEPVRRELWKWALMLGIVVLVFEWYIYNQRVYV